MINNFKRCNSCGFDYNPMIYDGCPNFTCWSKKPNINFEDTPPKEIPLIEPFNFYPENDYEKAISEICDELKETLIKKNRDYGDSFSKLYHEYGDLSVVIRFSDKIGRYKNLISNENLVKDESIEDTVKDIGGYAILRLASERAKK